MLEASLQRLAAEVPDTATVLDIGGWAKPLARADWVIDLLPYETRGLYGRDGDGAERFSAERWIQRDLCDRQPYPFADDAVDFAVCSQTLEDVRDPIWVCAELNRIARAGYIEVPSRLEEQSWGVQGDWVGWGHHHWLIDATPDGLDFVFKPHVLHGHQECTFPAAFAASLSPAQRVQTLWWQDGFSYRERVFIGPGEVESYLGTFVEDHLPRRPAAARSSIARRLASILRR